jgi:NAD(P)H dehydrogenase (quinone)
MSKILILYYSSYGHVEAMAEAIAEGAKSVANSTVSIKRVPELVPRSVADAAKMKVHQSADIASPDELDQYDAIVIGSPTRYGNMAAQMRNFLDQTGAIWLRRGLVGKIGSAFVCTSTQHGGQETTLQSIHTTLLHHGMVIVGVPYAIPEMFTMSEIAGGTPYGATTISGPDNSRLPSAVELAIARFQGAHVASIAARLAESQFATAACQG